MIQTYKGMRHFDGRNKLLPIAKTWKMIFRKYINFYIWQGYWFMSIFEMYSDKKCNVKYEGCQEKTSKGGWDLLMENKSRKSNKPKNIFKLM